MGSPRRILHLVPTLIRSGAETQLSYLAPAQLRAGWDVHVGFLGSGAGSELNEARLEAGEVPMHRLGGTAFRDPRVVPRVARLVKRVEPDLVQTWLPMMDIVGGLAARWHRVPWVLSERNSSDAFARDALMRFRRRLARGADRVVANSTWGTHYWRDVLPEDRILAVPNALPLDELDAVRPADPADFGIEPGRPLVVWIGRFEPQKNVRRSLEVLALLMSRTDASAIVAGRGSMIDEARAFARDAGLDGRMRVSDFIPDPWSAMRLGDVFLSLSRFEGMPNTVMEAASLGQPIVLSDIPTHREVLAENEAWFVDADDPEAVVDALMTVLEGGAEVEARASAAKARSRAWSVEAAARAYIEIYESVLG